jgi:uncharacterized protein (UPF0332 family)
VSPRSEEFVQVARRKLQLARSSLQAGFSEDAAAAAYYAMLSAARAALSEQDVHAKTHNGVWTLFSDRFVRTGAVGRELGGYADAAREHRQQADYETGGASPEEALVAIGHAEEFVERIEVLLR